MKRWVVSISVLLSTLALADAVQIGLEGRALLGKGLPALKVEILEPIAGFEVKLQRSDGQPVVVRGGGKPGVTRRLELPQPEGRFHYTGVLTVNFPNASTATMPLEFDTELLGPLRLTLKKEDLDLGRRKAVFTLSREASKAHLQVLMDTGTLAVDEDVTFNGEAAGTPLELTWPEAPGKVMKIAIQAYDTSSFFTGVEIFPWQVDIPHEEVNFDSGKAEVRKEEQAKLDNSLKLIGEAVSKFGSLADLKLYIAGHTDSVGSESSNRGLSHDRARSIGQYLRKRGLRIPIYYEGFGEDALLVPTQDETAEARNRRAEYIIAVEHPVLQNAPFAPQWRRL